MMFHLIKIYSTLQKILNNSLFKILIIFNSLNFKLLYKKHNNLNIKIKFKCNNNILVNNNNLLEDYIVKVLIYLLYKCNNNSNNNSSNNYYHKMMRILIFIRCNKIYWRNWRIKRKSNQDNQNLKDLYLDIINNRILLIMDKICKLIIKIWIEYSIIIITCLHYHKINRILI